MCIRDRNGTVALGVEKHGKVAKPDYQVDGISGGTITSKGVDCLLYTSVEYHTSKGRIDLVLQTDKLIYVMEFKLDGTAEEALQQIHDKHYALPFASDGRKLS